MSRSHSYGEEQMTGGWACLFYFLVVVTELLLFGVLILSLVWVYKFHGGFAWNEDVDKQFNVHPVLMITGFIFFMGRAMLVYRLFRCCHKAVTKLLHTILLLCAVPCIVVGTIAVFDFHNLREKPFPNLYSLHSWCGLITIGLFGMQFVVGFVSFWLLSCCDAATAGCRAALLPVHTVMGVVTFFVAIATALTGYTERALFTFKAEYSQFVDQTWYVNAQGTALVLLAVVVCFLLFFSSFARRTSPVAFVQPPSSNSHYVMTQKSYYYRDA